MDSALLFPSSAQKSPRNLGRCLSGLQKVFLRDELWGVDLSLLSSYIEQYLLNISLLGLCVKF